MGMRGRLYQKYAHPRWEFSQCRWFLGAGRNSTDEEAERGGEKKTEANRKMKWNDTKRIKNGGIKNETG